MGLWSKEVVRVDGDLMAFVKVQDDWTGGIRKSLREIHIDGNRYYIRADGKRVDVTEERARLLAYEDLTARAIKAYKKEGYL